MEASPPVFKGIALFTPGGVVIYCIDPHKQARWHMHLCGALQHLLNLAEPPHFLTPCYAATIDRSLHPKTQQVSDIAEASALVIRYQPLLNAIFETPGLIWQKAPPHPEICDPAVLATYRTLRVGMGKRARLAWIAFCALFGLPGLAATLLMKPRA